MGFRVQRLNLKEGVILGGIYGSIIGSIKGDTRSLDYSSGEYLG